MKGRWMVLVGLALAVAVRVPCVAAEPEVWRIDVSRSRIGFVVDSFLFETSGTFERWKGTVTLDREHIEGSSVQVVIQADSNDTGIGKRDEHLRGADFLDTSRFPTMTFSSTRVVRTGDRTFDLEGKLRLHGVTQRLTIGVTIERLSGAEARFRGEVVLSRTAFGVDFNSRLNPISDEVRVTLVVTAVGSSEPEGGKSR